jgi:hypothetical protein
MPCRAARLDHGETVGAEIEPRDRGEQPDRVGMLRRLEQRVGRRRSTISPAYITATSSQTRRPRRDRA